MHYFTVQQIEVFMAVVENNTLSNAARVMYVSQPSVSKTLQRLETSIGVPLFDRSGSSMALTPEGEYLYTQFKAGYNVIEKAIDTATNRLNSYARTLSVRYHSSLEDDAELEAIRETFIKRNPNVELHEEFREFKELRNDLMTGEADIILSFSYALKNMPDTQSQPLRKLGYFIAMPKGHPLAQKENLEISELNGETFMFIKPDETQIETEQHRERCREAGFTPGKITYYYNIASCIQAMKRGKGLMLTCQKFGRAYDNIVYFPVEGMPDIPFLTAAWRSNAVTSQLKEYIKLFSSIV